MRLPLLVVVSVGVAVVEHEAPFGGSPVPAAASTRVVAVGACACPIPVCSLVKLPLHVLQLFVLQDEDNMGNMQQTALVSAVRQAGAVQCVRGLELTMCGSLACVTVAVLGLAAAPSWL